MDPVSLIVMALAAGAAAGLKPTATQAVRDAYAGIRQLIQRKYGQVDLAPLEQKPESEAKRASLTEDLRDVGAAEDNQLFAHARQLAELVEQHEAGAGAAVGIDLRKVNAAFLQVGDVEAMEGTGVRVQESEFSGGLEFGNVRVGREGSGPVNPPSG